MFICDCRLDPGETWIGEYVIRHHNNYWKSPIFGEGLQPMPASPDDLQRMVDEEEEEVSATLQASAEAEGAGEEEQGGGAGEGDKNSGDQ